MDDDESPVRAIKVLSGLDESELFWRRRRSHSQMAKAMTAITPSTTPSTIPTTFPTLEPPPPAEGWPRLASEVAVGLGVMTTVRTSPVTVVTLVYTSVCWFELVADPVVEPEVEDERDYRRLAIDRGLSPKSGEASM